MTRARWAAEAKDLTDNPGEASKYLTVGQLSDAIGLAAGTIKDSITRKPITNALNPRIAICRPAAHIGEKIPLWTKKQRDDFLRIRKEAEAAREALEQLPSVTVDEALHRKLFSLVEFADMFDVHDQTLRRAQSQDGSFPQAVARRSTNDPGVPEHLFELDPMVLWARAQGYTVKTFSVR